MKKVLNYIFAFVLIGLFSNANCMDQAVKIPLKNRILNQLGEISREYGIFKFMLTEEQLCSDSVDCEWRQILKKQKDLLDSKIQYLEFLISDFRKQRDANLQEIMDIVKENEWNNTLPPYLSNKIFIYVS